MWGAHVLQVSHAGQWKCSLVVSSVDVVISAALALYMPSYLMHYVVVMVTGIVLIMVVSISS